MRRCDDLTSRGRRITSCDDASEVGVAGRPARLVVIESGGGDVRIAYLDYERAPGQSCPCSDGAGSPTATCSSTPRRPSSTRRRPLQLHLAPAGFTLDFFKDNGRIVRLADATDPERMRGLSVQVPFPDDVLTASELPAMVEGAAGPVEQVTVHGRAAALVPVHHGEMGRGWFLQAQFPDGTTFEVQAPETLTREQVLQIGEQITYTP